MGTRIFTDGTTSLNDAELRKLLSAGGAKLDVTIKYAHIRYNGASWEVDSGVDSAVIVTGDLTWNVDALEIGLAGYTNPPVVLVAPADTTALIPKVVAFAAGQVDVEFFDEALSKVTTEATTMDFTMLVIGT